MEQRLLPVNGLLALCQPGELNRSPLAMAGFRIAALEVPVGLQGARVVIDVVLVHEPTGLFLACESKSGANVEPAQARRYAEIDPADLVYATGTDLRSGRRPTVSPLYVCLGDHSGRIRASLAAAGAPAPVLAIGPRQAELWDAHLGPAVLASAMTPPAVGLPFGVPRIIPCDDQSPQDVVLPQVKAVLVQHLSRRDLHVAVSVVAHETLAHLPLYGERARKAFQRRVDESVRRIALDQPATFEYVPGTKATGARDPLVRFARSPEDNDNRGRTQAYQALARDGRARRRARPADPDQLDLFQALGPVDSVDEQTGTGAGDTLQDDGEGET